jgi:hypothetical protein
MNRSNLVDNPESPADRLRPPTPARADSGDSTRGGTIGERRPSHPSRAAEEGRRVSCRTSSQLPERVLFRGYGLDPDDLELEMILGFHVGPDGAP